MFRSGIFPDRYTTALMLLVLAALYVTGVHHFLLFHSAVETFTVVIAWGIFMVAWNTRHLVTNRYLLFVGIGYLFVGCINLLHMLAYRGMGIFSAGDANLPTQLWLITRFLEAATLFVAPFVINRKINPGIFFAAFSAVVALLLLSVFHWGVFPDSFVEGVGLTTFKLAAECAISLLFAGSVVTLWLKHFEFERNIFWMLTISIVLSVLAELAFALYVDIFGRTIMIGHFLRLVSSYFIYRTFIWTGIGNPFNLVFRDLARGEKNLFSLLEGLPAFVYLQMPDYSIRFANRVFRNQFGDPEGKFCYELLRGKQQPCDKCPTMKIFETGTPQHREWIIDKDKAFQVYEYPFRDIDDSPAVLKLGIDITERKSFEEQLVRMKDELEERVASRTAELKKANTQLRLEIAERRRVQEVLQESEAELEEISIRLLHAQEEERKRIAIELHDSLGGSLSAIKMRADAAIAELNGKFGEKAAEHLESILPMIQGTLDEVRRIHSGIWPSVLSDLGLLMALRYHSRKFEETCPHIRIEMDISIEEEDVPEPLKIVIYRIVQEALSNVAKHSGADAVRLILKKEDASIVLLLVDNGRGFSPDETRIDRRQHAGVGLPSMRERARLSRGLFSLRSGRDGTVIRASWEIEKKMHQKDLSKTCH